jgi:hypothetical protein
LEKKRIEQILPSGTMTTHVSKCKNDQTKGEKKRKPVSSIIITKINDYIYKTPVESTLKEYSLACSNFK